jgi:hypothetical protein
MKINDVQVKTKQQMADEYGVCRKTFQTLLRKKRIILDRGLIYPKDQLKIYNKLGFPKNTQNIPSLPKITH